MGKAKNLKEWRDKVLGRDGYICQKCGARENLVAHHIGPRDEYPNLKLDINNGVTLCRECHAKQPVQYKLPFPIQDKRPATFTWEKDLEKICLCNICGAIRNLARREDKDADDFMADKSVTVRLTHNSISLSTDGNKEYILEKNLR